MSMVEIPDWDEEEEKEPNPGLETLPALPSWYSLFDWTNWQSSKDALVPGMPTKYFAKEAWNAIVDKVNDVLKEAGIDWYDPRYHDQWKEEPYTVEDSKILRPYGQLTASSFNTVCNNIDQATPLQWAWAVNPGFRGYVGKPRFKGTTIIYDEEGAISKVTYGDTVYPEYILELVHRINLMIGLMRGTTPTEAISLLHRSGSLTYHKGARSLPSVPIQRYYIAQSNISSVSLGEFDAAVFTPQHKAKSLIARSMEQQRAAAITDWINIYTNPQVSGKVYSRDQVQFFDPQELSVTNSLVDLCAYIISYFSVQNQSQSSREATLNQAPPLGGSSQLSVISNPLVNISAMQSPSREVLQNSKSSLQPGIISIEPTLVEAARLSSSKYLVEIYMAVITRLLMYTNFALYIQASAQLEYLRSILMHSSPATTILAQPRQDVPVNRHLGIQTDWILTASSRQSSPNKSILYGSDFTVFNANPASEAPKSICLFFLERVFYKSFAQLNVPKVAQLFLNQLDLYVGASALQSPVEIQQALLGIWYYNFGGKLQSPEKIHQAVQGFWYFKAAGLLEDPEKLQQFLHDLQMIMNAGVMRDSPRQIQAFQRLYDYLNCSSVPNSLKVLIMHEHAGPICMGYFFTEAPEDAQGLVLFSTIVRGNASLNSIAQQLLHVHDYTINTCQSALQVPLEYTLCISIQAPGGFVAGISWDTPRDIQMLYGCLWQYECNAQLQDIAKTKMHSLIEGMQIAYASLHIPDTYFLWTESIGLLNASTNLETPSQQQMYSELRFVSKVDEKLQGPQVYKMQGFSSFVSYTDEKTQKILKYAAWITSDVIGYSAIYLQVPTATTYMQSEASEFLGLLNPFLRHPDTSVLSTTLATASQGFAKLLEPTEIRANSTEVIQSIAHAFAKVALVTRTYTSGRVIVFCIACTYPGVQTPSDTILWFTKSQGIEGSAYSVLAKAVNSAGIAYMFGVTGSAGHDLLSRVLGAGIGLLSGLHLLGAGNTARAIASAGRYVHIELISEFLCQYSLGREYHIRMHANLGCLSSHLRVNNHKILFGIGSVELPKIKGDAYSATQHPGKVAQHVTVEKLYTQASNVQSVEPHLMMCNANIGSAPSKAGATVRSMAWIYPVQTGSNLYIKQVYEATLVGTNLIIK